MTLSSAFRYPRLGGRGTSQFRRPDGVSGVEYNMSRVQGKNSNLFSELSNANLKEECESCRNIVSATYAAARSPGSNTSECGRVRVTNLASGTTLILAVIATNSVQDQPM